MKTVEIFTDESLTGNYVTVGGLILIHERPSRDFHRQLFDNLQGIGLWGVCGELCNNRTGWATVPPQGVQSLSKGSGLLVPPEKELALVKVALANAGAIHVAAFSVRKTDALSLGRWKADVVPPITTDLLETLLDRRLSDLLKRALEVAIYELPAVTQALKEGGLLAVDLASRFVPRGHHGVPAVKVARQEWGLNVKLPQYEGVFVLASGDAVQTFDEIVASRGGFFQDVALTPKVARIRVANLLDWDRNQGWGVTPYDARYKYIRPHQIHYLADWVANSVACRRSWIVGGSVPTLSEWLNAGFELDFAKTTEAEEWLSASRKWKTGNRVDAVRESSKIQNRPPRFIAEAAAQWFGATTAEDLRTLFQGM